VRSALNELFDASTPAPLQDLSWSMPNRPTAGEDRS
jgi:hypothetical protein